MTDDHGLGVDQDAAAQGRPVIVNFDAAHDKALAELRREGHLWSPWAPKDRTHKYRMCMVLDCKEVQVKEVHG